MNNSQSLPETGFIRVSQIIGDAKRGYPALIPISRTSWWQGVKDGRFPKPIRLGPKTVVWRIEDIRKLIQQAMEGAAMNDGIDVQCVNETPDKRKASDAPGNEPGTEAFQ